MQQLTFLIYSNLVMAAFLIFLATVLQTPNFRSAILFKVIPETLADWRYSSTALSFYISSNATH